MMVSMSTPGGIIESGLGTNTALSCGTYSAFNAGEAGAAFLSASIATAATPGSNGADIMSAGLFAVAFGAAGTLSTGPSVEKFAAHALLGCMQGAMGGGKCGPSMMAAVVGKGMTEALPNGVDWRVGGAMTAIAGGTASVIGGGKFANGAFQAGFGYLYNHLATLQRMLSVGASVVQSAWGRLQMLAASPAGQLATQMAAAEVGVALPAGPIVYGKAINEVVDLLDAVPDWSRVHRASGDVQGFVFGDAQQLFSHLTRGATEINPGVFKTVDNFILHTHNSTVNGVATITIRAPEISGHFVVRVLPKVEIPGR
jgi:hypothetical protein